ncbi:hypothetical protein Gogos_019115 [Gossypium gossypioides]|uniref:Uncharacterized protein n=1 Tax=Gossypium gossypioides TaxID=34282 RepID=A0A7J9BGH7_GOSGO|nr:hypothetical protein [Gossypium gossypioides]
MGLMATTISTSQGDRSIHVPIGDEMWDAKVLLVVYAMIEMHELDRVLRKGRDHPSGSLSTPAEDALLVATQYPGTYFGGPCILHPYAVVNAEPHVGTDADVCTATNDDTDAVVDNNVDA